MCVCVFCLVPFLFGIKGTPTGSHQFGSVQKVETASLPGAGDETQLEGAGKLWCLSWDFLHLVVKQCQAKSLDGPSRPFCSGGSLVRCPGKMGPQV